MQPDRRLNKVRPSPILGLVQKYKTRRTDFCTFLRKEHGVSCVPGSAFGLSPHLQISTAAGNEALAQAMDRIAASVGTLV